MGNSYSNARPVWYDPLTGGTSSTQQSKRDVFYASQLEFSVWKKLVEAFGQKRVLRQVDIPIKPTTPLYPALGWRCDFRVCHELISVNGRYFNVEAKGFLTEDFRLKLQLLEFLNPFDYHRIIIVGKHKPLRIDRHFSTVSVEDAIKQIRANF